MDFCTEEVEKEQSPGSRGPECHGGTRGKGVEEKCCGRGGFSAEGKLQSAELET